MNARRSIIDQWFRPVALVLSSGLVAPVLAQQPFAELAMRIERNITDEDHEVVVELKSGDTGLATLQMNAPDGRTVFRLDATGSKLGIRQLAFESPEPKDLASLLQDYPAGDYQFSGTTVSGEKLAGKATLAHPLPEAARFVRPRPDDDKVAVRGMVLQWQAAPGLSSQSISIEDELSGAKVIAASLPGDATRYAVADQTLKPATLYKLAIGAIAPGGNASYVEAMFTTAARKP